MFVVQTVKVKHIKQILVIGISVLQAQGTVISLTTAEIAAMIVPIVEPDQSLLLTFASWELSENRY